MRKIAISALILILTACSSKAPSAFTKVDKVPTVFPDYTNITVPCNIAPMNFLIDQEADRYLTLLESESGKVSIKGK